MSPPSLTEFFTRSPKRRLQCAGPCGQWLGLDNFAEQERAASGEKLCDDCLLLKDDHLLPTIPAEGLSDTLGLLMSRGENSDLYTGTQVSIDKVTRAVTITHLRFDHKQPVHDFVSVSPSDFSSVDVMSSLSSSSILGTTPPVLSNSGPDPKLPLSLDKSYDGAPSDSRDGADKSNASTAEQPLPSATKMPGAYPVIRAGTNLELSAVVDESLKSPESAKPTAASLHPAKEEKGTVRERAKSAAPRGTLIYNEYGELVDEQELVQPSRPNDSNILGIMRLFKKGYRNEIRAMTAEIISLQGLGHVSFTAEGQRVSWTDLSLWGFKSPTIGLLVTNVTSNALVSADDVVRKLFSDEDNPKIVRIEKDGEANRLVVFKTYEDRDAALSRLSEENRTEYSNHPGRMLVKVFKTLTSSASSSRRTPSGNLGVNCVQTKELCTPGAKSGVIVYAGPPRVLEIACNDGDWCFKLKRQQPDWIIEGVDDKDRWSEKHPGCILRDFMNMTQINVEHGADYFNRVHMEQDNPEFTVRNINQISKHVESIPHNLYSFVRARMAFQWVESFKAFMDDVRLILQPDGVLEFIEVDWRPRYPLEGPVHELISQDHRSIESIGWTNNISDRHKVPEDSEMAKDVPGWNTRVEMRLKAALRPQDGVPAAKLKQWIQSAGFTDVKEIIHRMPIGGDSAAGQKMLDFVKYEVGIEDELPQLHDLPKIEMEAAASGAYYFNLHIVTARKPLYPRAGDHLADGSREEMTEAKYKRMQATDVRSNWQRLEKVELDKYADMFR